MTEDVSLEQLLNSMNDEIGIDFRGYKHTTLERRLRKRMHQAGVSTYAGYITYLADHPEEKSRLIDTVLINVTEFFRDPQAWEIIEKDVLPVVFRRKRPGESLRVWVAGCSSGEEVYSLAILIAEHLGPRVTDYDIRIYATDVDNEVLNIARRGEYHADKLRRLRADIRSRYFQGEKLMRVVRDIRRMAIFGKSDLVHDAPISHVDLVICRNVLIYFDSVTQKHILSRLHYALEPGGFLFLGKAESKLTESTLFTPVHSRWRIFRRKDGHQPDSIALGVLEGSMSDERNPNENELALLKVYHRAILEVLDPGVILLDNNDVVQSANESVYKLWNTEGAVPLGRSISSSALATRCPDLIMHLHESRTRPEATLRFQCRLPNDHELRVLEVILRPVLNDGNVRIGTLVYVEDVTHRERLQHTIEQLEHTSEELQSANEELETTNEELQSTNEELETTNEELQSTNEELETTNEELHSLNEELENMNEELEMRSRELDSLNSRYAATLEQMPWAVMLVDSTGRVQFWNSAATRLFGQQSATMVNLELSQVPMDPDVRQPLMRKHKLAVEKGKPQTLHFDSMRTGKTTSAMQVLFTPVSQEGTPQSVLIMFSPEAPAPALRPKKSTKAAKSSAARGTASKKKNSRKSD
jgi:two-component system, chemotaxis family, CheB/CheR fusion protein